MGKQERGITDSGASATRAGFIAPGLTRDPACPQQTDRSESVNQKLGARRPSALARVPFLRSYCSTAIRPPPQRRRPESPLSRCSQMPSPRRAILALAIGISAGLVILVAAEAVRNYPSPDGITLRDGELLGGDFVAFYVAGRLFDGDRDRLYDLEHQRELRTELFGPAGSSPAAELPFVYPPLVAALASPFSRLPFQRAFLLWTLAGLMVSLSSLVILMRSSGATEVLPLPLLILFSLGFVPFSMNTVLGGQVSWLGMAIMATLAASLLVGRDFQAGLIMSLSYYKPPLFLLLLIVLVLARGRRFLLGFASGAGLLVSGTLLLVGPEGFLSFLSTGSRYVYGRELVQGVELPPAQGMGLVAFGVSFLPSLTVTLGLLAVPFLLLVWTGYRLLRHQRDSYLLFGLILCSTASLAFSVQLIKYDLSLLLIPMTLGVAWFGKEQSLRRILILLPFLGFYLEFVLREVSLGGMISNSSAFLFLLVLVVLVVQGFQLLMRPSVLEHHCGGDFHPTIGTRHD